MKTFGLYALAALFIFTGITHFLLPETFRAVIPPYLPYPEILNLIAGAAEIGLALGLLFRPTRRYAAWGLIALLIAVFPANIYMYQERETLFPHLYGWALAVRLPVQFLMIYWAYIYTQG